MMKTRAQSAFLFAAVLAGCGDEPKVSSQRAELGLVIAGAAPQPLVAARRDYGFVYDRASGFSVLYGGHFLDGSLSSEVLIWPFVDSGSPDPKLQLTSTLPFAAAWPSVAVDDDSGTTLFYGGMVSNGMGGEVATDRYWIGGPGFYNESPSTIMRPSPRAGAQLTFDAGRHEMVLVGGSGIGNNREVWTWQPGPNTWLNRTQALPAQQIQFPLRPIGPELNRQFVTFANDLNRVVLTDGQAPPSLPRFLEWNGATWTGSYRNYAGPSPGVPWGFAYNTTRGEILALDGEFVRMTQRGNFYANPWIPYGDYMAEFRWSTYFSEPPKMVYDVGRKRVVLVGLPASGAPGMIVVELRLRSVSCSSVAQCETASCSRGICTDVVCGECTEFNFVDACTPIAYGTTSTCSGERACYQGVCKKIRGAACNDTSECHIFNGTLCTDGYCCENAELRGPCGRCDGGDLGWPNAGNGYLRAAPLGWFSAECGGTCVGALGCTACQTDAQCGAPWTPVYCSAAGECVPSLPNGSACNLAAQCFTPGGCSPCESGHCVEGVCCDTACERCGSCTTQGQVGQCVAPPAGISIGQSCASHDDCCGAERCVAGVCVPGSAPVFQTSASLSATRFVPYRYSIDGKVRAAGGQPMRYSLIASQPASIDPVSGEIFFVPSQAGNVQLAIRATNPWGSAEQRFTVAVSADGAPRIERDANSTAVRGLDYVLNAARTLRASGAPPIVFTKVEGPDELHVSTTGVVTYRPRSFGHVDVSIGANNVAGSDVYRFGIDVAAAAAQGPPIAMATATPTSGNAPLTVQFDTSASHASGTGTIVSRLLSYGDGSLPSSEPSSAHTYAEGAYVPRLVVLDNLGQSHSVALGVQAGANGQLPSLVRIVADVVEGPAPLSVRFSCDCGNQDLPLRWSFGDGETSTDRAPVHVFARAGGYPVTLEAFDEAAGALASDRIEVRAASGLKEPPSVVAYASPVRGDAPLAVTFTSLVRDIDGSRTTPVWRINGEARSTEESYSTVLSTPGRYEVLFAATDEDQLTSSARVEVEVTVGGLSRPQIVSVPTASATVGVAYRYSQSGAAVARGGKPLTWSLGKRTAGALANVPDGMVIDATTGQIAWTPTAAQRGQHSVTIVATNAAGEATQDFVVDVQGNLPSLAGCDVTGDVTASGGAWAMIALTLIATRGRRRVAMLALAAMLFIAACSKGSDATDTTRGALGYYPTWIAEFSPLAPSPRYDVGMAYHAATQQLVAVGGHDATGVVTDSYTYHDASPWTWDGGVTIPNGPRGGSCAVTYDVARELVVNYDGEKTWEWDGSAWTERSSLHSPPNRRLHCATYAAALGGVVLFGGLDGATALNDTWLWDGNDWIENTVTLERPFARFAHAMASRSIDGCLFMATGKHPTAGFITDGWMMCGDQQWSILTAVAPSRAGAQLVPFQTWQFQLYGGEMLVGDPLEQPGYDQFNVLLWDGSPGTQYWTTTDSNGPWRSRFGIAQLPGPKRTVLVGGAYVHTDSLGVDSLDEPLVAQSGSITTVVYDAVSGCFVDAQCPPSSYCTDNFCCESSSCGLCERCGGSGRCERVSSPISDDTCPSPNVCSPTNGLCGLPTGEACTDNSECATRFCADGYCCNSACNGACQQCNGGDVIVEGNPWSTNGSCTPTPDLTEDPKCGGSLCAGGSCIGGCGTCNGSCFPGYVDCASTHVCETSNFNGTFFHSCRKRPVIGELCTNDCYTGTCVDSYCCDTSCEDNCSACNLPGLEGTCTMIPDGAYARRGECAIESPSTCGISGVCDGAGGCKMYALGTECESPSCSGPSESTNVSFCDGAGTCVGTGVSSCGNFACQDSSGQCATSCTDALSCAPGSSCLNGQCEVGCDHQCTSSSECCLGQRCVVGQCASGGVPSITSQANLAATRNQLYHYDLANDDRVTATGAGTIRFSISSSVTGVTIDPVLGKIYFVPTVVGDVTIVVRAQNEWGAAVQVATLSVASPEAPLVVRDASSTAVIGRAYIMNAAQRFRASGAGPIVFHRLFGPMSFHVDAHTGRVDWLPTATGLTAIRVRASSVIGSDEYAFIVNVVEASAADLPVAKIVAVPVEGPSPLDVGFDASSSTVPHSGAIVGRLWTFGDGSPPSSELATRHTYLVPGGYVARLLVLDNLSQPASDAVAIRVGTAGQLPPVGRIGATPTEGPAPLTVAFTSEVSAGAQVSWNFGDGERSEVARPMHVFARPGAYPVTLETSDAETGSVGTDRLDIRVLDGLKQPPRALAFAEPSAGNAPLTVQLGSQVGDLDGNVATLTWKISGMPFASGDRASYTFTTPGRHVVTLEAIDNDGLTALSVVEIIVQKDGVTPPSFLSTPSSAAQAGAPYRYGDSAHPTVRGDRPLTFTLGKIVDGQEVGRPAGMEIDSSTGEIAWTPSQEQVGSQAVTLRVANKGGETSQDFIVAVGRAPARGGCGLTSGSEAAQSGVLWMSCLALLWWSGTRSRRRG